MESSIRKYCSPVSFTAILLIFALIFMVVIPGCMVGPNYQRPKINPPEAFRFTPSPAEANSFAQLSWWEIYKDETLTELIRTAFVNNYDYRIAASRVVQSQAIEMQTASQLYPLIGYEGNASRGKNSQNNIAVPTGKTTNNFSGFLSAAWEVDFWGRIRRLDEAAKAQFLADKEAQRNVEISLISNVATAYFELLELDNELEIAQRTTKSFQDSMKIFKDRFEGGVASELEVVRAQAALSSTAAVIPDLERHIAAKEDQINVLLGNNPGYVKRSTPLLKQSLPIDIPPGLPSELLERRPDIRQAEQQLRAANANIGATIGDFFPRLGLTALYGGVSNELSTITLNKNRAWSIVANITGPIFQGGRLKGQYLQVQAQWEEAKLQYEQTVIYALQEVSDALIYRQKLQEIHDEQTRAVQAYQRSVEISTERYKAGQASYYEVLEAQQLLFPAEISLAQAHRNQLLVIVQLYMALGGGWEIEQSK